MPITVAIGWTLANPAQRPASIGAPAETGGVGAGELGSAPDRPTRQPDSAVQYSTRPLRPGISAPPSTAVNPAGSAPAPAAPVTSAPVPVVSDPPLPPLNLPPVPTPTEISASPTTSTPEGEDPSGAPSAP